MRALPFLEDVELLRHPPISIWAKMKPPILYEAHTSSSRIVDEAPNLRMITPPCGGGVNSMPSRPLNGTLSEPQPSDIGALDHDVKSLVPVALLLSGLT